MEIIIGLSAFIIGFLLAYLLVSSSQKSKQDKLQQTIHELEKQKTALGFEKDSFIAVLEERLKNLATERDDLLNELLQLRTQISQKDNNLVRLQAEMDQLQERLKNQKAELTELQQKFTAEFENLANRIFKQHSSEFVEKSGKNIHELINPLKEKLQDFEKKVQEAYNVERHDKISLKQEVKNLIDLNRKLSEDAENLTKALKGDSKKQGNWGEIVLERVLERSGLTKGAEYETQTSTRGDDNQLLRPDVVIYLPDQKHLIVDSKVSLVAYEQFINNDDPVLKEQLIRRHVDSVRMHIKSLSEKNYQLAGSFDTPDFVLLFLPIESAFSAALQSEPDLFGYAWERKIVMVSPTTLLATLKTVASIWKQEKQTQNALEIARQGGGLYDKFVSFLEDLQKLGNQLNTVQKTYDELNKKFSSGSGNLIGRAEKLRQLGVKVNKNLPSQYLISDSNDEETI